MVTQSQAMLTRERAKHEVTKMMKEGPGSKINPALSIAGFIDGAFPNTSINWGFVQEMAELCEKWIDD